ncbi:TPA: flap endonuclease [Candidatus Berkelbacteria bacterium]|uniref:Polymerase I, DNA polymerase I protein n=1 Tax=Berkelbacteria bacterium GW2011_GWE1_39_12 TaxID=1618337 RepID=A0A0G4B5M9_9BACT|nr:MAG: polymerase I, DNA polymerase I protein [Berkelbacteria bacterium GW2011_GWE1_39_12]HBO60898.1 flap endonuclease [Candidatus Berkelbacteria bacterium]
MIKNRFVLIDAFALIFRAYYALPPSMTSDGHPVQAAYGFTSALLSAIRTLEPEYLAVGMDLPKPTKRHADFVEYKAHRAAAPEDLSAQIPYVRDVLKTMNVPCFAVEGYEGEDVLATIVAKTKPQLPDEKFEFIYVTGDMDLLQLIDEQSKVYSMARGVTLAQMYDIAKVKERYGLKPSQFVDFKALKGDASDNIPGVPGIGEKTASKLIIENGSLDKIYENIELISGKVHTLLKENKEQAYLSQKLSKIVDDAPLEFKLSDAKIHHYDQKNTIALFNRLGFKSLIARLPKEEKPEPQPKLF